MIQTLSPGQSTNMSSLPTLVEFLLDETGSMESHKDATIGGYNDFLDEQRQENNLCLITLTKFDSFGLRTPYIDMNVNSVPKMTTKTFIPNAMTNLYDAIVNRIANLRSRLTQWDIVPNILFVAMTDGEDNRSRAKANDVNKIITELSKSGWTFVYLGANANANVIGHELGFSDGNIKSFETTKMRETMQELGRATKAFRASGSTSDFFSQAV